MMQKDDQNKFYTSISKYYSEIFPYKSAQLQFIKNRIGKLAGKKILDIGCATGELTFQIAKSGAYVTGIDLNRDLLQEAKSKGNDLNVKFQVGNMLDLKTDFQPEYFDVVLCFGNTLVHLENLQQVQKMLQGVYSILNSGGYFLLQILNYDYILDDSVTELPLIETENIRFVRKYKFQDNNPLIYFQTELKIKKSGESITNETKLLALKSGDLDNLLKGAGFRNIRFYSNFKAEDFSGKHLPLVISSFKS